MGWLDFATSSDNVGRRSDAREIPLGSEFEVVGELYSHDVAKDLNKRKVDVIVIVPLRLSGPEILSRHLVPLGSRIRVISKAPKRWPSFLHDQEYVVEVDSITPPSGVLVVLGQSRGNEGTSTLLNPSIYRPLEWQAPGVVGRPGTPVEPGGAVSNPIETRVPAGYTFGEMHDSFVDRATKAGVPDLLANVPSMPFVFVGAFFTEILRSLKIVAQPKQEPAQCK